MPKVFYSENPNSSPPGDRNWEETGSGSEAETELENGEAREHFPRRKHTHRRTETMDVDAELQVSHKRSRPPGNAVMRQKQVSREVRDATGQRPLQKACSRSDLNRVEELLANKPDLQDRDYAGTTALHTAALQGDAPIVRALLNAGAVPDVRSGPEELDTPLMDAAANGFLSIVEMLLSAGADPRVTNARGRIAADFVDDDNDESEAIQKALQARTTELRRRGVSCVSAPTDEGAPQGLFPPGFAGIQRPAAPMFLDVLKRSFRQEIVEHASTGDLEYVGQALERGWQPTAEALVKAAKFGHSEIVGLLLAFGLNADAKFEGTSALSEAIRRSHLATVKLLLDSGASLKPHYRKLVVDLPDWDELGALVKNITPAQKPVAQNSSDFDPKPVSKIEVEKDSKEQPEERSKEQPETEYSKKSGSVMESLVPKEFAEADADVKSMPAKRGLDGDAAVTESRSRVDRVEQKQAPSNSSGIEALKPKQSPLDGTRLSKIGLRSIKPKKRSKVVAEGASRPHEEAQADKGFSASTTELPVPPEISTIKVDERVPQQSATESLHSAAPPPLLPDSSGAKFENADRDAEPLNSDSANLSIRDSHSSPSSSSAPASSSDLASAAAVTHDVTHEQRRAPSREQSQEPSSRGSSRAASVSGEIWEERSHELSELAQLKAKQRRDREVRMLESLAQEQRRRSGSHAQIDSAAEAASAPAYPLMHASPNSPKEAESDGSASVAEPNGPLELHRESASRVVNKNFSMEDSIKSESINSPSHSPMHQTPQTTEAELNPESAGRQKEVSVAQLPWILRQLAYTGRPQPVSPLLVHTISGVKYYLDLQVSVAFGEPLLHLKFPKLGKVLVTSQLQHLLWSFCSPWVCRPKATAEENAADRQKFLRLTLSWVPVSEVEDHLAASSPLDLSSILIQLELSPSSWQVRPSGVPFRWQRRAELASSIW